MAKTITGKQVGDSYYQVEHPSGLTVLLYPKEHCSTTYAIFGTRYGSIDNCFQRSDEAGPESVPEGIAHYLEHTVFWCRIRNPWYASRSNLICFDG